MRNMLMLAVGCSIFLACNNKPADTTTPIDSTAKAAELKSTPQSEFADAKFAEIGKKNLQQLSSGDIDGWMNSFADNAVYR